MDLEFVRMLMEKGLLNQAIDLSLKLIDEGAPGKAELLRICSKAMFLKNQYIDAAAYGTRAIEADRENGEGYMHLGWAEYWLGRNIEALEHLEKAAELLPKSCEAHYRLGSILNNAYRDYSRAESAFTAALAIDPSHSLAWQQRAISRFNQDRQEEAYEDYRKGAEAGDSYCGYILNYYGQPLNTPEEKLAFARDCWANNQSQQALDLIREALDQGFGSPEVQTGITMELGDKLSWLKINDQAETAYAQAIEMAPDNPECWGRRGWHFYCVSRDGEAETDLMKAYELNPDNPRYPDNLGRLYAISGRGEKGIALLDPVIDENPYFSGLFYSRGLCHKTAGNTEKAQADLLKADYMGHPDSQRDRRAAYGDLFAMDFFSAGIEKGDSGDYSGAIEAFRKGAELFGQKAELKGDWNWRYQSKCLHNLGYYIHISGGSPEEAISTLQESLAMDPDYKDAWISLGNALNDSGDNGRALECFSRAVELQPNDGRGYYSRGRIRMANGEFDAGAEDFTQATIWYTRRDWQADAFFNRAKCHEGAGRIREAVSDFEEAFNRGIQQGITESFRLKDQYGLE